VGAGFSTVTPPPSQVSATSVAQAVWSYSPRSLTDIQSLVTAIQNNDPNLLSTLSDILYVPAPYYTGQVSATQVAAFIDNAIRNYGMVGAFASFISNYPYGLWSTSFVSNIVTNPYLTATSVAMLVTNQGMSANSAQFILYQLAQNYYYNKWVQTVTANAPSSITFSANATLSTNVLIAQNITIASGVTVTCGTTTCFFIAQSFNNQGTIVAYGAVAGKPSYGITAFGGAYGGTGGGGVVIIAYTAAVGTINVNGANGQNASLGSTTYIGGASLAGNGVFTVVSGVTVPSGGNAGQIFGNIYGYGEPNGGGGGYGNAPKGSPGSNGGSATIYSFPNGNALITYLIQGVSDWWLSNVIGKTPSQVTPLLFIYGSGGGGGGNGGSGYYGGGGAGGGGGEAIIYGYDVIAGTVDANGGTGGNGSIAGGGGGGGVALVFYGPGGLSGTMSYSLAGGAGGVGSTSIYNGYPGGTGSYLAASVTVNG